MDSSAPPGPALGRDDVENAAATAAIRGFSSFERFPYGLVVVPGYTPLSTRQATPGVHPVAAQRLQHAADAWFDKKAPFVLLSGSAVYPPHTPYFEALEMKRVLLGLGVPAARVVVDTWARHTTTNLRNAGRFMLQHGIGRALIVTAGGGLGPFDQAFYIGHPRLSGFEARCQRELGYPVGALHPVAPGEIAFVPSLDVSRPGPDALDP